jgi:RNA polymerase sigma factor (sigma-70 family)
MDVGVGYGDITTEHRRILTPVRAVWYVDEGEDSGVRRVLLDDSQGSTGKTAGAPKPGGERQGLDGLDRADRDWEEYVREFLAGRPEAISMVSEWMRSVVMHRIWGFQDSEDIVQAALLALVGNLRAGRFRPGNLRAYARRIAKNMCVTHYRRVRSKGSHVSLDAHEHLSVDCSSADRTERRAVLDRVLDRLDEGCRKIIDLAYVQGYSRLEISKRLGVSEAAVRVRLYRCIRKARALMEGAGRLGVQEA